jgi:tetratricopeptide (TPR) repeat protein
VLLVGPAGIGKTRTLEELCTRAALPPERVLWGRCNEDAGAPAYWPWVQILRGYVETCGDEELRSTLGEFAGDVARLIPRIAERIRDLGVPAALDPEQARFRLFDAVSVFLRRAAARAPLLVLVDDLQLADDGSLRLLAFLAREIRASALLVVAACREQAIGERAALLEAARAAHRLPLRGLDLDDVARLLEHRRRDRGTPALARRVHRVTEGNPFFVEEMLRVVDEEPIQAREAVSPAGRLPEELRDLLALHLAPLGAEERSVLTTAAIMGVEFDLRPLAAACGSPAPQLLERLDAAVREGLVEEVEGGIGRFRFRHALIRETLYGELAPAERAGLHLSIARALEAAHGATAEPPLAELAHHFHAGAELGEARKAIVYSLRAARRALTQLAYEDAVAHYERAHDASSLEPADADQQLRILLGLADAVWQTGDHDRARTLFERATRVARALGDPVRLSFAALGFSRSTPDDGAVHPESIALLDEALASLPASDSPLRAILLSQLVLASLFTTDRSRLDAVSRQALETARRLDDPRALAPALLARHLVLLGPDATPAERLVVLDEALALARRTENLGLAQAAQAWRVVALLESGDASAARLELASYRRRWEESRLPVATWHARALAATGALLDGRLNDAMELASEALASRSLGLTSPPAQFYATQAFEVLYEWKRLAAIEPAIRALAAEFPALQSWRCLHALVLATLGRKAEVRTLIAPLAAAGFATLPRDGHLIPSLAVLAEAAIVLGERGWIEHLYPALLPFAERNVVWFYGAGYCGAAAHRLGRLAEALGRIDDAVAHLEDAVAMNARMGAAAWAAHARLDLARVLAGRAASGDRERAERLLEQARQTAAELSLPRLAGLAADLAAAPDVGAGSSARPERPAGRDGAHAAVAATATLRRDGTSWTVGYRGDAWRVTEMKGLGYLARLIAVPGVEITAVELLGGLRSGDRAAEERARVNVTRAIAAAERRIAALSPELGRHLSAAVRTGIACVYEVDPDRPLCWSL